MQPSRPGEASAYRGGIGRSWPDRKWLTLWVKHKELLHGRRDTEELRKAVVHYRVLFSELLEVAEAKHEVRSDKHAEVRT